MGRPRRREKRRAPAGEAMRRAVRAVLSFGYFSLHKQRKVTRRSRAAAGETLLLLSLRRRLPLIALVLLSSRQKPSASQNMVSPAASPLGRVTFSLLLQKKLTKKKAGPVANRPMKPAGPLRVSRRWGTAHNSLRSDTWASPPPIAAAMLGSLYGEGKQQQQPRQQQQQQQQQKQKRQQLPRQQRRRRRRAPPNSGSRRVDQSACRCPEDPLFRQVP